MLISVYDVHMYIHMYVKICMGSIHVFMYLYNITCMHTMHTTWSVHIDIYVYTNGAYKNGSMNAGTYRYIQIQIYV